MKKIKRNLMKPKSIILLILLLLAINTTNELNLPQIAITFVMYIIGFNVLKKSIKKYIMWIIIKRAYFSKCVRFTLGGFIMKYIKLS